MSQEEEAAEKEHEPTQKRLDEARKRGDIAQSADLTTAATYGGFVLACLTAGPEALRRVVQSGAVLIDQSDRLGGLFMSGAAAPAAGLILAFGAGVAPFVLLPAGAAIIAILAQNAAGFAPDKLAPKWSRISPMATIGHKFGREGLFEFAKSAVKLVLVSAVLFQFLLSRLDDILQTAALDPSPAMVVLSLLTVDFLWRVLLISALLGGVDLVWQKAQFRHRNRMSRQELIDEHRESDGDPHAKAERRQRGQDIAMNRMLSDVPRADVVIVNPQHYAVALVWNRASGAAPVCVAKGADEIAAQIRSRASEAGVPIRRDPPTARALFATVEIGAEIRPEHYRAVAAAIRFAEAMRRKARERR